MNLKEFLDIKSEEYNNKAFIENDPIQIPHKFKTKEDIEISAFLTATISWGNRKSIINSSKKMMGLLENDPHQFIINHSDKDLKSQVKEALNEFVSPEYLNLEAVSRLVERFSYCTCDLSKIESYKDLSQKLSDREKPVAYYLAISPSLFEMVSDGLKGSNLITPDCRIVIEKPIGFDLETSQEINEKITLTGGELDLNGNYIDLRKGVVVSEQ